MEVLNYNFERINIVLKISLFTIPVIQLIQNKIFALIHENP